MDDYNVWNAGIHASAGIGTGSAMQLKQMMPESSYKMCRFMSLSGLQLRQFSPGFKWDHSDFMPKACIASLDFDTYEESEPRTYRIWCNMHSSISFLSQDEFERRYNESEDSGNKFLEERGRRRKYWRIGSRREGGWKKMSHWKMGYLSKIKVLRLISDIVCTRGKGYFGSDCKGINGTMDRSLRGHTFPA